MEKCIIAAVADDWAIGKANTLPWHLPADLKFFKKTTMGCPVIMGRATFLSIGRPLPGRLNIVLSRSVKDMENVTVAESLDEAYAVAEAALKNKLLKNEALEKGALENSILENSALEKGVMTGTPENGTLMSDSLNAGRCFVIGGASVYREALADMDRLFVTHVHTTIEDADAFFPEIAPSVWDKEVIDSSVVDEKSGVRMDFAVYSRKEASSRNP